jgi:hypothetical protein
MENEEILQKIKNHYLFFKQLEGRVSQKILDDCIKHMELLFLECIKQNIKSKL